MPLLQSLKVAELHQTQTASTSTPLGNTTNTYLPRSVILTPTHELSRQMSGFAKSPSHEIKLIVVCVSRDNLVNRDAVAARVATITRGRTSTNSVADSNGMNAIETEGEQLGD